jgi:hypothetical protein
LGKRDMGKDVPKVPSRNVGDNRKPRPTDLMLSL